MSDLHGVNITEGAVGSPPINLPDVSNIGVIGTAPGAAKDGKFAENGEIQYNHPFLITSLSDAKATDLGTDGTLPDALAAIYAQGRARVVFGIVPEIPTGAAIAAFTRSAHLTGHNTAADIYIDVANGVMIMGSNAADTSGNRAALEGLVIGQKISISPPSVSTKGVYTVTGPVTQGNNVLNIPIAQETAEKPTIANDDTITIEVAEQDGDLETRLNATGADGEPKSGVYTLLDAEAVTGVRPNIILAPDLGTGLGDENQKNPLGAALETVATRLRGIALIAGPNSTHEAAVSKFAPQYGSDRVYLIDPYVKTAKGDRDATSFIAGLIVKNDATGLAGWANSPSNQLINNVLGTARPIDYVPSDPGSRAQLLNQAGIATIINRGGGYRLWGNETPASNDREFWKFINVRRISDVLYNAIQENHEWAVAKGITPTYFEAVSESVNALIRTLKGQEALIEGTCYPDGELNNEDEIKAGRVYFNVEYTPVYPAQSVNINVQLTTGPLNNLV